MALQMERDKTLIRFANYRHANSAAHKRRTDSKIADHEHLVEMLLHHIWTQRTYRS